MKNVFARLALAAALGSLFTTIQPVLAQGTAFTYQGQLSASGSPANGNYDFTFALFNNPATNTGQIGGTLTDTNVGVTNGLFTVTLDFGANFPGASRWLALAVRTNGGASFTALSPLQALTPTPYAIYTPNSGTAANVTGPIALSQLPGAVVTNGESGLNVTGTFNGNGGGLANLNLNGTQGSLRVASTPVAYSQSAAASNAVSILAGSHYAGLACGTNGLSLFDISNLFAPALVAVCNQGFTTYGFTVNQGYMYVASGAAGMRVYSVSNFASPVFVTQVADLAPYYQVVQSGSYAYVGGYSNIAIYSLSNPASPVFLGQLPKSPTIPDLQTPRGLAVAGNYLYSANAEDVSFRIYSITNPASPVLLSQTSTACVSVTISGNLAFLSAANFGFLIYDISNPSSPNLLASPPALGGGEVLSIQVSGNRCFAAEVLRGLAEYDISVTTNPVLMTVFTNTPNIEDLVLWDNFALTANFGPNALQVLAVGDTADLVAGASANAVTNNAVGVTIAGGGAQTYFFTGNPNGPAVSVGGPNQAGADFDTISGGLNNTISNGAVGALIDGGVMNLIGSNALVASIGGGFSNSIGANSQSSVIGGGNGNTISSNVMAAVIAGGSQNFINTNSSGAAIGGGQNNQVSSNAQNATIPGGYQNLAAGNGSFAAGQQAQAMHQGAFVWADSSGGSYSSTANNQFAVRAYGGVRFDTSGSGVLIDGQPIQASPTTNASLLTTGTLNDARLSGNVPLLYANQTFTGQNTFNNNVGINTATPVATLDVNGNIHASGTISGNGGGLTSLNAANLTGALPAISGASLTTLNASQLTSGTIPQAQLPAIIVTNTETGVNLSGTFSGNGSGLTSLPAANLTGALPAISGTNLTGVALLIGGNSFTGNQSVNGTVTATSFSGSGSGLTIPNLQQVALLKWGVSSADNTFTVGSTPFGICFDGASIWVANFGGANVTKLNASTGATIGTYNVGSNPYGICFDGSSIWVANDGSGNVTQLNASTGATVGTYSVGTNPRFICFDGSNIWVANSTDSTVTKLNASTGASIGTYNVGSGPYGICFDGSSIWTANTGGANVTKLNASNGAMIGTYTVGSSPNGICFDGSSIWTANYGSGTVTKLNASTGATLGTYSAGTNPFYTCFDGASIWVSDYSTGTVTRLNASTGATVGAFSVGSHPRGICFDGASIWVANQTSNNVNKL